MKTTQSLLLLGVAVLVSAGSCNAPPRPLPSARIHQMENDQDEPAKSQAEVASKTATFATIAKDSEVYTSALEAHDLDGGLKKVDQDGAFKGTVFKVFKTRDGDILILNFDKNYRSAMNAVLKNADFDKFPDMDSLTNKEVVVTGKFVNYQGRAEIVLSKPEQIKLVQ